MYYGLDDQHIETMYRCGLDSHQTMESESMWHHYIPKSGADNDQNSGGFPRSSFASRPSLTDCAQAWRSHQGLPGVQRADLSFAASKNSTVVPAAGA